MNQMPSVPCAGSIWFTVAPVQAVIAGCSCTVEPAAVKLNGWLIPVNGDPLVRRVVIHVALVRLTLAPTAFVGNVVIRFGKIRRSRIQRRVQVVNVDQHSVRSYIMSVAGVIICRGTVETSAEWIDPGARPDAAFGRRSNRRRMHRSNQSRVECRLHRCIQNRNCLMMPPQTRAYPKD